MKKIVMAVISAAFIFSVTGCNTVKGVGQDVSKVGQGIDHAAQDVSNKL